MNRLRNRLILIFLAATLAPLAATVWITTSLLEESVDTSSTTKLDPLSKSLKGTARGLYERASDDVKHKAAAGEIEPHKYLQRSERRGRTRSRFSRADWRASAWCAPARRATGWTTWCATATRSGSYSESLGDVAMDRLTREIRDARRAVEEANARDLRRGIKRTYIVLAAAIWLVSLALLVYLAHRISRPIQELTAGLGKLAGGDLNARVQARRDDEIGRAIGAFNNMAARLQESTERLVYLRQLASWQTLARKMAHEVKNSLTPIRLTVEEMLVRYDDADRGFMEQATQIVVDEIETLERRIRAFSQFAAEPPVQPGEIDVNGLLQERIAFLKTAHPEVAYDCRLAESTPPVVADQDLLKGILTNLLENAAEAAGEGGRILGVTAADGGRVAIEVHDSGTGVERTGALQPVSTHHLLQETRHGAGAFHRAQERAAERRRHCCGERRTGRRRLPRAAARGNPWHPNAS